MTDANELIHKRYGNILVHQQAGLKDGLYKILIPKGTHMWGAAIPTFKIDEPATALLSLDAPPVPPGTPSGVDTRKTLQRLWEGETISFYSPENSGALTISTPEDTAPFRADRDRWLYLHLDFPGVATLNWESRITLHADAAPPAPAPVPAPAPEAPNLEVRTIGYAKRSGFAAALIQFAGTHDDAELLAWIRTKGDLWPSICRLAELAEEGR